MIKGDHDEEIIKIEMGNLFLLQNIFFIRKSIKLFHYTFTKKKLQVLCQLNVIIQEFMTGIILHVHMYLHTTLCVYYAQLMWTRREMAVTSYEDKILRLETVGQANKPYPLFYMGP